MAIRWRDCPARVRSSSVRRPRNGVTCISSSRSPTVLWSDAMPGVRYAPSAISSRAASLRLSPLANLPTTAPVPPASAASRRAFPIRLSPSSARRVPASAADAATSAPSGDVAARAACASRPPAVTARPARATAAPGIAICPRSPTTEPAVPHMPASSMSSSTSCCIVSSRSPSKPKSCLRPRTVLTPDAARPVLKSPAASPTDSMNVRSSSGASAGVTAPQLRSHGCASPVSQFRSQGFIAPPSLPGPSGFRRGSAYRRLPCQRAALPPAAWSSPAPATR